MPTTKVKPNPAPASKRGPVAGDKPAPVWPAAGRTVVDLATAHRAGEPQQADGLPIRIAAPEQPRQAAMAPEKVRVEVLDRAETARASVQGLLMRVARADGATTAGQADFTVDYRPFATAYGGDWASRLRLISLPPCALTTPQDKGCVGTPLPSRNNVAARTVSATVPVSATDTLLALTAAPSGPAGDYSATSLQASSTWTAGGNSGAFTWSYPMRTPPAPGGTAPVVALGYSSQSVDGRHAASNNQPSWIGEGFEIDSGGFIERRYKACAQDIRDSSNPSANNDRKTGDLCWETDNAVLSLNGTSGELIYNASEGRWHLRSDDGSRIRRETGASNGDNNGEHWVVTAPDGVQYWFGLNRLPGWTTDKPVTNSTLTVPVFGNEPNEPCHATAFADSDCMQAWRWNLDYVVDPSGNSISYWYKQESNKYGRNLDPNDDATYHRGGWLDRIDYGTRQINGVDSVHTTPAPLRVDFQEADRCLSDCGAHNEIRWPDTPWDQECSGASCTDDLQPTFWSTKRLSTVTTQVRQGSGYTNVERWTLTHSFPDPGDGTRAGLWLDKISHAGLVGGTTTVPDIEFTWIQLANRVDATGDFAAAMNWMRITEIRNETGGSISVNYSAEDCKAGQPMPTPHTNTRRCYPVIWEPEGYQNPVTDWFHKYVVTTIYEQDNTGGTDPQGSPRVVYRYDYPDGAAWHYTDDDGLIDKKHKTWSDYRGYGKVAVTIGEPGEQTYTETRYFRGMHGDKLAPSGGTRTATVDGINDEDWYAGMTRETKVFNGPTGPVVSRETNVPWPSPATATRTINGDTVTARYSRVATVQKFTTLDAGRGERSTTTTTSYDSYGMATSVDNLGQDGVPGDEQCSKYDYTPRNTDNWLMDRVHRVQIYATQCSATTGTLTDDDVMGEARTFYDNHEFEVAPSRGLVTRTDEMTAWNAGAPTFATKGRAAYDVHGRATSSWDAMGYETKTEYTPASDGPVTATKVTNPLAHATTTTINPAWGHSTTIVDPNSKRTDLAYDGLGRLTAVWLPGRTKDTDSANATFGYHLSTTTATAVSTSRLNAAGNYITTYNLYDGLLRPRQTQNTSPFGGRLLTDTFYDTAGREVLTYSPYHTAGTAGTVLETATDKHNVPTQNRKVYDGLGRVTAAIFQPYGVERWRTSTYHAGDRIDSTPPDGGTALSLIVDVQGRTRQLRQYHGPTPTPAITGSWDTTAYAFNRKDQLTEVTDPAGNKWTYKYDIRGRQTETNDPDKGRTTLTYDNAGRITTSTDAEGNTLAYVYDQLNRKRVVYENQPGGPTRAQWFYDTLAKGHLSRSTRAVGSTLYEVKVTGYTDTYEPTGTQVVIPATETGLAGTYNFDNTWNIDGSLAELAMPGTNSDLPDETLTYGYTDLGLPNTLRTVYGNLSASYVTRTDYNALGQTLRVILHTGTGGSAEQAFDHEPETGRLTRTLTKTLPNPDSSIAHGLADIHYSYDPAGNITQIKDTIPDPADDTQCFRYDHHQRLRHAWTPSTGTCTNPDASTLGGPAPYWHEWTYDKVGNRQTQVAHNSTGNATTTYHYPPAGSPQPHTLTSTSGAETGSYTYDATGNTRTRPSSTGAQTLTWDPEGHLETSTDDTGETRYIYDADGNRLIRRDPTGKTLYLPGQEIRHTYATNANVCTRYYTHGGAIVASRTNGELSWLTADPQGTAQVAVTAITQTPTVRRQLPFGAPRGADPAWPNDKGFVGGTRDNTGLTHLGAREYDPQIGRFISVDPIMDLTDPQQIHGYTYANNNPITLSDPDGLDPGGGQACDNGHCSPSWGADVGQSTGGSTGSGGTANQGSGSISGADRNIEEILERNKQLFLETFSEDNPYCQAPGMASRCATARNQVKAGYDPYSEWVRLICGDINTNCLNQLGYRWNCGLSPCPALLIEGGEILVAVAGGVEAMGGRSLIGGLKSLPGGAALLARLKALASGQGKGGIGDVNAFGYKAVTAFCSFSGDTRVLMADGSTKAISEIRPGDKVVAADPETGEQGAREVTRVWVHEDAVVRLEVEGATLTTTEDHPFWNETDQQWQRADALDLGDQLLAADGTPVVVGPMANRNETETVYNLTVAAIHTYYVLAGDTPVLVHNAPGPDPFGLPHAPGVYIITLDTGEKYVGQGKDIATRWRQHFSPRGTLTKAGFTRDNIAGVEFRLPGAGISLNQLESEVFDEFGGKAGLPYNTNNPTMYKIYGSGPGGGKAPGGVTC
ncbi:polymorphic toxin-type HINT domain-containing protein [Plantactinospora sp. CA-294935]|uniref:polymorphic toxin-type HINT domain-containing protein n=1 Tax=Plantactinospora sp. CA-294935 TaxID=3240012 RepID=UPI003D94A15C